MKIDLFNLVCYIVMIVSFVTYLVACRIQDRTAPSISASFYKWVGWKRIWFILALWGTAIPILVMESRLQTFGTGLSKVGHYILILAAVAMMIIAVFADYLYNKVAEYMHVIPSYIAAICGIAGVTLIVFDKTGTWTSFGPIAAFMVFSIYAAVKKIPNMTRWQEIASFISVAIMLIPSHLFN